MLTLERASELISKLRESGESDAAIDLFCHFEELFKLHEQDPEGGTAQTRFAAMCGFGIATNVRKL